MAVSLGGKKRRGRPRKKNLETDRDIDTQLDDVRSTVNCMNYLICKGFKATLFQSCEFIV